MKAAKKILAFMLAAALIFGCVCAGGMSAQAAEDPEAVAAQTIVPDMDMPESRELYEGYLERLFYGGNSVSLLGEGARGQLNSLAQPLYDFLKEDLLRVAAGETESTFFTVNADQITAWGGTTAYEVSSAENALACFMQEFEVEKVVNALLHDCPYELYWFDKVSGVTESASFSLVSGGYAIKTVTFKFAVVSDLQPEDYSAADPSIDISAAASAGEAAENAREIVDACAELSDYEMLIAYKDKICELVSYEKAASNGHFSTDADPWQLLYVFDGDDATNVVCEGYSKAFQYLCDMSVFRGDVSCVTVTGRLPSGGHMWNIVTIGGENYLADVTNSDAAMMGQDGGLFLAGTETGSIAAGYTFRGTLFTYDEDTLSLWGTEEDSVLKIAQTGYLPGDDEDAAEEKNECGKNVTWEFDEGSQTLTLSGTGEMYDYDDASGRTLPWDDLKDSIVSVNVETGVTSIGAFSFSGCEKLCSVMLPDTLVSIGDGAFQDCVSLQMLTIPGSVKEMGERVFSASQELELEFLGDAPEICGMDATLESGSFSGCQITAYYPAGKGTWNEKFFSGSGENVRWIARVGSVIGDINNDGAVSDADAVRLQILLLASANVEGKADVNGDGKVTTADAVHLLWYTLFPDVYPLKAE